MGADLPNAVDQTKAESDEKVLLVHPVPEPQEGRTWCSTMLDDIY